MLEEAHLKLEPQDAATSLVYLLLAHLAILDGGDELCVGLATQVFVHSGTQRHHASLLQVARHMVGLPDAVDAVEIGNDKATEAPLAAQDVIVELAAGCRGDAVERVVGCHDRESAGVDSLLERGEEGLQQVTLAHDRGVAVLATLGGAIGDEVLQRGEGGVGGRQFAATQSAHDGCTHLARQHGVFAIALLDA